MMLTKRQLLILEAIIRDYTSAGQPIGSKTLQNQLPVHVSSATIRNEMATLEKLGYLIKEHSSSGRYPSLKGYRFYVDHLVKPEKINKEDIQGIRASFGSEFQKVDEIVATSARVLSEITNYTAISLKPDSKEVRLEGFRMVPFGEQQVMVILVTSDGSVESQIFSLPEGITGEILEPVIRIINDQVVGYPLSQIADRLQESIVLLTKYLRQPEGFLDVFGRALDKSLQSQFYVGGKMNLLNFIDSDNVDQVKALYSLVDHSQDISALLGDVGPNDITVKFGNELQNQPGNYSLISAHYNIENHGQGIIALLGPTNMPYSKLIGLLGVFRQELTQRLIDYYRNLDS